MAAEMYRPCPTLRKVPLKHLKTVSAKIGNVARHAVSAESAVARERALRFFFLLPRLYFQAPLRDRLSGSNSQRLYNARSILVEERLSACPRARFLEYRASLSQSDADARRSSRFVVESNPRLRDEVMRQVHEGYLSRAASLASSPGLAPYCEATAEWLRAL